MTTAGEQFVRALAAKDAAGLVAVLDDDVSFMGLTPSRVWEASTPDEVAEIVFGHWFEDHDRIDGGVPGTRRGRLCSWVR